MAWLLDHFREARAFTADEVSGRFASDYLAAAPADKTTGWLNGLRDKLMPISQARVVGHSSTRATVALVDVDGAPWRFNCATEESPSGRINLLVVRHDAPSSQGVAVREATADDATALAELERAAPWELGDMTLVTDRGSDYFAPTRLLDASTVVVAERDGAIVGVLTATSSQVQVEGDLYQALCVDHARVHPDHQGVGIVGQLMTRLFDIFWALGTKLAYGFVHPDNARLKAVAARALATEWSVHPVAITIEADDVDRPAGARPSTPDDLGWIADVLNDHHADEILWSPSSVGSLRRRLTRAPDLYSYSDLWVLGGAVLGTWAAHRYGSVTRVAPEGTTVRRDAVVLDHGCERGAEDDLRRLLAWRSAEWRAQGATGLLVLTSPGAKAHPLVQDQAACIRPFDVFCQPVPEPEDSADRGVYVDPLAIPAQTFGAG